MTRWLFPLFFRRRRVTTSGTVALVGTVFASALLGADPRLGMPGMVGGESAGAGTPSIAVVGQVACGGQADGNASLRLAAIGTGTGAGTLTTGVILDGTIAGAGVGAGAPTLTVGAETIAARGDASGGVGLRLAGSSLVASDVASEAVALRLRATVLGDTSAGATPALTLSGLGVGTADPKGIPALAIAGSITGIGAAAGNLDRTMFGPAGAVRIHDASTQGHADAVQERSALENARADARPRGVQPLTRAQVAQPEIEEV